MKSYVNQNGAEIFRLDDFGNLWLMGNLTLGTNGILTAATIDAINNDDMAVVRDPEDMETPYTGEAAVVYYLGESTETYTYGTWWEKYTIGYDCVIDTESVTESQFIAYEQTFRVLDDEHYAHNKEVLDQYPATRKIVATAVQAGENEENGHWEVKYYDANDELLFNDILHSNLLYFTGYYFPFTPLNADDYDEGSIDITMSVEPVYALKEINPVDWSLYMPLAGGTFTGVINTENIAPNETDTYIIGTPDGRYKAGYFQEVVADVVRAQSLALEALEIDSFGLSEGKTELVPGDALVIADTQDDGNLKRAIGIPFTGDTTKYLRQDGTFAVPKVSVPQITTFDDVEETPGLMVQYVGEDYSVFTHDVVYLGVQDTARYQFRITGVTFGSLANAGIIATSYLNTASTLIAAINALNIGTVNEYITNQGYVTLVYSSGAQGWYIDGQIDRGVVPKNTVLGNKSNAQLINELVSPNTLYNVTDTSDAEIRVTISTFVWEPVNPIQFDGVTTNQYLSKAGTWESIYNGGGGGGETPASEGIKYIVGNITINSTTGEVSVTGLDNSIKSGTYELRDASSAPQSLVMIDVYSTTVYQTLYNVKWNDINGAPSTLFTYLPEKLTRKGTIGAGNVVTWTEWVYTYNTSITKATLTPKNTWRTPTYSELNYLLYSRPNANNLRGKATVGDTPGLIILDDNGTLPSITGAHFTATTANFTTNKYSVTEWNKYYSNLMIFLPVTGQRLGNTITNTKAQELPTCAYWTATRDAVDTDKAYAFMVNDNLMTLTNISDVVAGFAVRLIRTSGAGNYSISATQKAFIAKGNLQYHPAANAFRFARNQYDVIGVYNANIEEFYDGWIDLFGYGTSGADGAVTNHSQYVSAYTEDSIEDTPNLDWGVYNPIYTVAKPSIANCLEEDY